MVWLQVGRDIDGAGFDIYGTYYDSFFVDMSEDGKTIVIGAPLSNENGSETGLVRVYIFDKSGSWVQVGQDLVGFERYDHFGYTVEMSADSLTIATIEYFYDSNEEENDFFPPRPSTTEIIRVYTLDVVSKNWTQVGSDINGTDEFSYFGRTLAMSADGKTIVVGADGLVQVYTINNNSSNWVQLKYQPMVKLLSLVHYLVM
jgi:hypothetical protein